VAEDAGRLAHRFAESLVGRPGCHTAYQLVYRSAQSYNDVGGGWGTWWGNEMDYFNQVMKARSVPKRWQWHKYFDTETTGGVPVNRGEYKYWQKHPSAMLAEEKLKMAIKTDMQHGLKETWQGNEDSAPRGALFAAVDANGLPGWSSDVSHYLGIDG